MIDRNLLEKGAEFEDLEDTYVIFITENDKFKEGVPVYHIERKLQRKTMLYLKMEHILFM